MKVSSEVILEMNAYHEELDWWKDFVGGSGIKDLIAQADPSRPVVDYIAKYMRSEQDVILDVGAGPLTQVGYIWKGKPAKIVAVDPLADSYNALPFPADKPVITQFGVGEILSDTFQKNTFDIAHARNSLDHSFDPLKCIYEMINVVKPGGVVILHHCAAEGNRTGYVGLHKWDFFVHEQSFYISNAKRDTVINVTNHLGYLAEQADISTPQIYSVILGRNVLWADVVFRKRPE